MKSLWIHVEIPYEKGIHRKDRIIFIGEGIK
jgi:hypothetical protein